MDGLEQALSSAGGANTADVEISDVNGLEAALAGKQAALSALDGTGTSVI